MHTGAQTVLYNPFTKPFWLSHSIDGLGLLMGFIDVLELLRVHNSGDTKIILPTHTHRTHKVDYELMNFFCGNTHTHMHAHTQGIKVTRLSPPPLFFFSDTASLSVPVLINQSSSAQCITGRGPVWQHRNTTNYCYTTTNTGHCQILHKPVGPVPLCH